MIAVTFIPEEAPPTSDQEEPQYDGLANNTFSANQQNQLQTSIDAVNMNQN